ncbi:MAG: methyltransferase domain-containing protein [Thermodesulfovibrionales bacterium]
MNFPCHFEKLNPRLDNIDPVILHYHWLVDAAGYIKPSPYPFVNRRIEQFNQRLRVEREKDFNNRLFWNFRYTENPELGSGLGSRGEHRDYKRALLTEVSSAFRPNSILDIGCGDMEVGLALPAQGYAGLDISDVVVEKNRQSFLDRTFVCGNFLDLKVAPADMVVCMDVLIHLNDYDYYKKFIAKIVAVTAEVGVIAGYERDPGYKGIVFFHEALSKTLRLNGVGEIKKIGEYRDTTILQFIAPSSQRHAANSLTRDDKKNKINVFVPDKNNHRAICILGMHRSGTSAIARALNLLGVYLGEESDLYPALDYNPEGLWERIDFNKLQERLLAEMKRKWDTTVPFPDGWQNASELRPFRDEISSLVRANFSGVPLWGWKDPRSTIFIELWKEVLIDLGVDLSIVFMVRNPLDVARSLQKRDGFALDKGFGIWFNYNITALQAIDMIPRVFISYDRFLEDWEAELRRISEGLAISWPRDDGALREKIASFIRFDLRHSASTVEDLKKCGAPWPIIELYELFERLLAGEALNSSPNRETVDRLWNAFSSYARFYHHDMTDLWKCKKTLDLREKQIAQVNRQLLKLAEIDCQLADRDQRLDKWGRQLAEKDKLIHDLRNSLSWKITAPLRWLADRLFAK